MMTSQSEASRSRAIARGRIRAGLVICVLCCSLQASKSHAGPDPGDRPPRDVRPPSPSAATPYTTTRVHRIGNIAFSITNWGVFGSERRQTRDYCTQLPAESFEFPIGSGVDYLWAGSMWVGAVRGRDTLVSVGTNGWWDDTEFFADPYPKGDIRERTSRPILKAPPNSRCTDITYDPDAISEQDIITVYYDTVTNPQLVPNDAISGRSHIPLGLEITQKSYAWSFDYAQDFLLMDVTIRNVHDEPLKQLFMGLFMDHDVGHESVGSPQLDDITGFTHAVPSSVIPGFLDTLNLAWIADNDGDPASGKFTYISATGVAGVRVVRAPVRDLRFSFNWWVSNSTVARDWGPNRRASKVVYVRGNLGTPEGDIAKYQVLSNGEFDYPQIEAAVDHQGEGWLPPVNDPQLAADLADGYDTRYLLSFGPFDVPPDSNLELTLAFVAGAELHTDPRNFASFFDPAKPEAYLERLDLSDFARNAQWAGWVYDTPGFDTDGDGFRGQFQLVDDDTIYYTGDGIPDFQGPSPPPPPILRFVSFAGKIVVRWNGRLTETFKDYFSSVADFEGYRVYQSRTGQLADYAMLAQRDLVDYIRWAWNPVAERWRVKDRPYSLDSLQALYDDLVDTAYGFRPFHPDSFSVRTRERALREVILDDIDPSRLDTNYYCFERYDANATPDDAALAYLSDTLGHEVNGVIRKRFPYALPEDTLWENGAAVPAYYEYEYIIEGLQLAEPVHIAVTAFDYGDPVAGLKSQESSPLANAEEVWPVNAADVVKSTRPQPGVYPNPYRLMDDYNAVGWEDPARQGLDPERARKVTFTNVPDTCVVSIWSLDGDLVRRLEHAEHPASSQATVVVWDLITRNTQAVKTGIYIYTIESRFGTEVGKLVIIK